jgi:hypothetical protein
MESWYISIVPIFMIIVAEKPLTSECFANCVHQNLHFIITFSSISDSHILSRFFARLSIH